jgi:hypothetical protein
MTVIPDTRLKKKGFSLGCFFFILLTSILNRFSNVRKIYTALLFVEAYIITCHVGLDTAITSGLIIERLNLL